jgi:hypothetical protein
VADFSRLDVCEQNCGCVTNPCYYVDDDFTRANETPVASPWTKLTTASGAGTDWNLASNVLAALGSATYKHNTAFPGTTADARHASVKFKLPAGTADGTTVEILEGIAVSGFFGQPYDWFASWVTYNSSSCCIIGANAFFHGNGYGGVAGPGQTDRLQIPDGELTLDEWHRLEICLIPGVATYGYTAYDLTICKITLANGNVYSCQQLTNTGQTIGDYAGLKFASSTTCEFDDFKETYYRNSPSGEHRTCPWCHTGCAISGDSSFNQPCKWDVRSGSYSGSGGVMTITADDSVIQFHIFHPGLKTTQIVSVQALDNGVIARVYIGNGYIGLVGNGSGHTLTLFDNDGSTILDTDEDVIAADSGEWLSINLCYSHGVLACSVTGHDGISLCVETDIAETPEAYWASLGGDNGATFRNFNFYKSYNSDGDTDCSGCSSCPPDPCALCDPTDPPGALAIDLSEFALTARECYPLPTGIPSGCEGITGEYVLIPNQLTSNGCGGFDSCCRDYVEANFSGHCCNGTAIYTCLQMGACIVTGSDPSKIRWAFSVSFGISCSGSPDDPFTYQCTDELGGTVTAVSPTNVVYYSEDFDVDECAVFPRTLTKFSEHISCPCGGSFPSALILDSAS